MKVFGVIIGIALLIVISFVVIFINTYPSFGGKILVLTLNDTVIQITSTMVFSITYLRQT